MRLLQLGLRSFGHFSAQDFDFPLPQAGTGGFTLIYGPNEAGKSTALRAVRSLLYGVPQQSNDTFLDGAKKLRLTGTVTEGKKELHFQRRKGRKNTFLDASGAPAEESELQSFLAGVDESMFTSVFGLNHETLRQGAEQLLAGEGKLAEGLFGVGLGAGSVRGVLSGLQAEVEALYTPKGRTRKRVNLLTLEVKNAERQVNDLLVVPTQYIEQQNRLRGVEDELAALQSRKMALVSEREKLAIHLRLLPKLSRREALLAELLQLGNVVELPPEFRSSRLESEQREQAASERATYASAEAERARASLAALEVPEQIALLEPELIERLQVRVGAYRKAADDLPKRRAELRHAQKVSDELITLYGHGVPREKVQSLRLDKAQEKLLERLGRDKTRFDAQLSERAQKLKLAEQEFSRRKKELSAVPAAVELTALRREIGQAKMHLRDESRLAERRRKIQRLERRVQEGLAQLGPFYAGGVDELLALPVPSVETLQRYAQRYADLEQESRETERRSDALRLEVIQAEEQQSTLLASGELPRQERLLALRRERNVSFQKTATALEATPNDAVRLLAQTQLETTEADDYADRLRAESRRSAQLESAVAKVEAAKRSLGVLKERALQQAQREVTLQHEWEKLWPGLQTSPGAPGQMQDWVRRRGGLVDLAEERRGLLVETREIEASLSQVSDKLGRVLEELGEPRRQLWEGPTQMVERAELLQEELARCNEQRQVSEQRATLAAQVLQEATKEHEESKEAHRKWKPDWSRNLKLLHLDKGAAAEEVTAKVEGLSSLFSALQKEDELRHRIAAMESDGQEFATEVRRVCEHSAPELVELECVRACEQLLSGYRRAKSDLESRERLGKQLERYEAELRLAQLGQQGATQRLDELMQRAGVKERGKLSDAERRSDRHRALREQLRELDLEMLDLGEGAALGELIEALRPLSAETMRRRAAELPPLLESVESTLLARSAERGELAAKLEERQSGALAAAELLAERRSELKLAVERYATLRLAMQVLQGEVTRYRELHQGPLLKRGGEWFKALTLGRYRALSIGYDSSDDQLLQCVVEDGREVGVAALSDGTRDQLYLALRLATWENYFQRHPAMPIILDDVLVHFDDERAAAALAALGQLSSNAQVLFFTHHSRLRDLASRWVPKQQLSLLALSGSVPQKASVAVV